MASKHGVIGGGEFGTELPVMEIPEQDLTAERNAAKFSRTREFAELKAHFQNRIDYYQQFLPGGDPVATKDMPLAELGAQWRVATAVIGELTAVIAAYEQANEIVKAENARRQA